MAGKLKGMIAATTPSGWRMEYMSIPGPALSVVSVEGAWWPIQHVHEID